MPDIKQWLCAAAATLGPGEVIKPSSLTYLEAMNALEMMDPAVDMGSRFSPHGQFSPSAALSPEQLCWIMDEMAARELAWLRGGTLAQTILTSLHYHNALVITPSAPPEDEGYAEAEAVCAALRAYVLAFAKGVEIAYYALMDGNTVARDGEDIWLDPYGVPLESSEDVDEVKTYVQNVDRFLHPRSGDAWWAQVIQRLRFRITWIDALLLHAPYASPAFITSTAVVPWAFDEVAPLLRQNMPLPAVAIPTHTETWAALSDAVKTLACAPHLVRLPLRDLEPALAGMPEMLPVVRAVYKNLLSDSPRDSLVDEWLSSATGQTPGVLARLDTELTGVNERRSFSLWRDIISGCLILSLTTPLSNPSRHRRALLHLSRTWSDQAASGARLARTHASFVPIVRAVRVRALDCVLHASLLAFDLRLVGRGETRAAWWYILLVARERVAAGTPASESAHGWLFTLFPTGAGPTLPQFILRHKIELGTKVPPVNPTFAAWEAARAALDAEVARDCAGARDKAAAWLRDADVHFAIDGRGAPRDIGHNLAALAGATGWEGDSWATRTPRLATS